MAPGARVVVMAAAVADYAGRARPARKISKTDDTISLVREDAGHPEDLGARRTGTGAGPLLVGFAAETEDVVPRAIAKRRDKNVDLIVANDVSRSDAGFDAETNAVTLVTASGADTLPLQPKARVAAAILDRIEALLANTPTKAGSLK